MKPEDQSLIKANGETAPQYLNEKWTVSKGDRDGLYVRDKKLADKVNELKQVIRDKGEDQSDEAVVSVLAEIKDHLLNMPEVKKVEDEDRKDELQKLSTTINLNNPVSALESLQNFLEGRWPVDYTQRPILIRIVDPEDDETEYEWVTNGQFNAHVNGDTHLTNSQKNLITTAVQEVDKGKPNGIATLDDTGNVPIDQLGNVAIPDIDLVADNVSLESEHFNSTDVKGGLEELFTSVSDGKQQVETSITDAGGEVSKQGQTATFGELSNGVKDLGDELENTIQESVSGRNAIKDAIVNKGGNIEGNPPSYTDLATSIGSLNELPLPIYFASGIENIPFSPTFQNLGNSNNNPRFTLEKRSRYMLFECQGAGGQGTNTAIHLGMESIEPVDLTNINRIYMAYDVVGNDRLGTLWTFSFAVHHERWNSISWSSQTNHIRLPVEESAGNIVTLDVSGLSGLYYIKMLYSHNSPQLSTLKVHQIIGI